jgi:hypothetical protein
LYKNISFFIYINIFSIKYFLLNKKLGIGDWGLGIGDWGFGPKTQTPNPKPPTPKPKKKKI